MFQTRIITRAAAWTKRESMSEHEQESKNLRGFGFQIDLEPENAQQGYPNDSTVQPQKKEDAPDRKTPVRKTLCVAVRTPEDFVVTGIRMDV